MVQYANVNFDTYIKKADLINAVLIKNPVPENINHVKTLDDLVKEILQDKKKQKDLDFVLEKNSRSKLISCWSIVEILNCS